MGLHDPIAHLSLGIHQDFIVVDNICGDLDFEDGGHPVVMNRVLAGRDPVLIKAGFFPKPLQLRLPDFLPGFWCLLSLQHLPHLPVWQ